MSQNNQNNNDLSGIWLAMGLAGAFVVLLFVLIYAVMLFITFVLTIIALCAWFSPVTIGKHTLEPDEARAFVRRGVIGAFLFPAFVIFCELVFGIRINGDYMIHFFLGGYVAGSLGVSMLEESNEANAETVQTIEHMPAQQLPAPKSGFMPPIKTGFIPQPPSARMEGSAHGDEPRASNGFTFATWDDEEAGR